MFDYTDGIALGLALIPCLAWFGILRAHYLTLRIGTQRVQTLITRIALFLPTYAMLLWISFVVPNLFGIMEAPIAIAEGLSFYGFFAMIVANLGGPDMTLKQMKSSNRLPCCCCPKDPLTFYNRVRGALFQFLVIRPFVTILAAYCSYKDLQAVSLILTALALAMLVYGFLSLVLFCKLSNFYFSLFLLLIFTDLFIYSLIY